ncbi:MAG: hypothetical protein EZS28_030405 [Streblomastix strix]|uniref:Uncharacterized protein n=1 Tax=Streblomastix strix TaxID=222440 RepID=A0A5J4UUJ7_9EUKA|nr:MAG: hypothetical protein EZS28_030405 [Streblomastix strix]
MPRNKKANNSIGYNGQAWWENSSNRKWRCGKENYVGYFVEGWHVRDGIVDCCDGSDEDLSKLYENDKKLALNSTLNVKTQDNKAKQDECLTQFVGMKFEGDDGIIHYSIDFGQIVTLEDGEEFRIKMELMEYEYIYERKLTELFIPCVCEDGAYEILLDALNSFISEDEVYQQDQETIENQISLMTRYRSMDRINQKVKQMKKKEKQNIII